MASTTNYQNTVTKAIHEIVHGSLCMAVGNFYEILNTGSDYDNLESLKVIKEDLFDIYLNLDDILCDENLGSDKRDQYKQKCYDHRNMLADMNLRLSAIRAHLKKKGLFFRHYSASNDPALKDIMLDPVRVNDELFALTKLLDDIPDMNRTSMMSSLMNSFPLRITRGLYFDYISKNLSEAFAYLSESEIDSYIDFCGIFFDPDKMKTGEFNFEEITAKIRRFDMYDEYHNTEAKFSDDIRNNFENEYHELNEDLDKIAYLLSVLFETINYLLIILNFAISFDYLTDDNFIVKDLYYLVKEAHKNSSFAFDDDIFSEKIENETEKVLDSIEYSNDKLEKELKKINKAGRINDPEKFEDEDRILTMFSFANQLFNEALYDIDEIMYKSVSTGFNKEDNRYTLVTKDLAKAKIDQLTEIIKASSADASARNRKLERQFFLEYVPCFLKIQEFRDYILNSFDNSSQVEILSALSGIHNYLDACGRSPIDYEDDSYDDLCDCGDPGHHHHH